MKLSGPANKTESPFDLTGAQWARLGSLQRLAWIEKAFRFWRRRGFPYYELSTEEIRAELKALAAIDGRHVIRGTSIHGSHAAIRLANYFHPQMWAVRVSRYKSPMDCFNDDTCFKEAIQRAFRIWPERHGANASCLRRMLKSFSNCAAVSNFRPSVARAVVQKFSGDNDAVVDFAAGYGGRLVGSLSLPRHYIGMEPCSAQVRGLRKCIEVIRSLGLVPGTAEIHEACAEDQLPKMPSKSTGLVFSSPPYFDWERYSKQDTQSFIRYKTYSKWLESFLRPVVKESHRILANGGYLAINTPNGSSRLSLLEDVRHAAKKTGFKLYRTYKLRLSKVPYLHPRNGEGKWEVIVVFRK
jgi:hypothetical protein